MQQEIERVTVPVELDWSVSRFWIVRSRPSADAGAMRSSGFLLVKRAFILAMALALSCGFALAEELVVFSVSATQHKISRYSVESEVETDGKLGIISYKPGKELGRVRTGDTPFSEIVEKAVADRRADGPFFGPGFQYLVKDAAGVHYLVFFEYEAGHETFTGYRMGVGEANDLGSGGVVFVGHAYDGVSFDKELLAQFRKIAERK